MLDTTEKFVAEVNEVKDLCMKELMDSETFENMDEKEIIALKKMLKLLSTSTELMVRYAEHMEEQENKIDRLLEIAEKRS